MMQTAQYRWGPEQTPEMIKQLIILTSVVTILSALIDIPISSIFGIPGTQDLFCLSWYGIRNFFIWEPITYLFVQSTGAQGITFFFLITLLFNMYMIWVLGSAILDRVGPTSFLYLYLFSGVFAGIVGLFFMPIAGQYTVLSGPTASILALLMVWTMYYPENQLLIFFIFPIKAKWLMAGIAGMLFLICLSQLDIVNLMFYFTGILSGYFYALLAWELQGPFAFSHRFDRMVMAIGTAYRARRDKVQDTSSNGKVVDLHTGKATMNDDAFIDAMLTKISKTGEKSLTWDERRRMQQISEKKQRRKESEKNT